MNKSSRARIFHGVCESTSSLRVDCLPLLETTGGHSLARDKLHVIVQDRLPLIARSFTSQTPIIVCEQERPSRNRPAQPTQPRNHAQKTGTEHFIGYLARRHGLDTGPYIGYQRLSRISRIPSYDADTFNPFQPDPGACESAHGRVHFQPPPDKVRILFCQCHKERARPTTYVENTVELQLPDNFRNALHGETSANLNRLCVSLSVDGRRRQLRAPQECIEMD